MYKKQHYVPKFLLRKFSRSGADINLLALRTNSRILGASLKTQCYRDHYYGKDGSIEKGFSEMEAATSAVLGELSEDHLEGLSDEDLRVLLYFTHYQSLRTVGAEVEIKDMMRGVLMELLKTSPKISAEDIEGVGIEINTSTAETLILAAKTLPVLFDLKFKFLINPHELQFVISDNPVAFYNQFAENTKAFSYIQGATGLAAKGLQIFLPLSPRVQMALYDPATYQYGSPRKLTCGVSAKDVALLNRLQIIGADDCVYFLGELSTDKASEMIGIHEAWASSMAPVARTINIVKDGKMGKGIQTVRESIKIGAKFSFAQVIDTEKYAGYEMGTLPVRSQELIDLAQGYGEFLDEKVEEKKRDRADDDS